MATRDRSQGVYFVYSDAKNLYKKALSAGSLDSPLEAMGSEKEKVFELKAASAAPTFKITSDLVKPKERPLQCDPSVLELQKAMVRMKHLQKKLKFMLSEIEQLVKN